MARKTAWRPSAAERAAVVREHVMAERDGEASEGGVARWVLIGASPWAHYRVSVANVGKGRNAIGVHQAACGYSYQKGFERLPGEDDPLPECPPCLAVMAETAAPSGVRG